MKFLIIFICGVFYGMTTPAFGQPTFAPAPPAQKVDETVLKKIEAKREELSKEIASVKNGEQRTGYADVAIYLKALDWITRHNEWLVKDSDKQALAVAEEGLKRFKLWKETLVSGKEFLPTAGKIVARGYISKIDGSIQPYLVSYPSEYGKDPQHKWRLDISLHGRDATLTEVKHLLVNGKNTPKDQAYVQISIYGRGNNAYRWSGETDVFEALEDFLKSESHYGRKECFDPQRIVLKGFSMGGAGTWHLGLHYPSLWAVMQPGAGFTTTHGYADKNPNDKYPSPIEETLTIYDAVNYAENARMIPVIAYSGEIDGQKKAADNIEAILKKLDIPMTHIIAPKLAHVPPKGEFLSRIELEFEKYIGPGKGKDLHPEEVNYVTYTLKYPKASSWIFLTGLDEHYKKARIHASRRGNVCTITTENISSFEIPLSECPFKISEVKIDGREVPITTGKTLWFEKRGKDWEQKSRELDIPYPGRKTAHHQGPIDDAFTSPFLCIQPSQSGYSAETDTAVKSILAHFGKDWDKQLRGKLPEKLDKDLSPADLEKNLILFGDPQSNPLIRQILEKLPVKWDAKKIQIGGQEFSSADHLPVLVYPNPLSRGKSYVVINSGHTFGEKEFEGTNALLYPRIGDYGVLKWNSKDKKTETVLNGLWDERWSLKN